MENKNVAVKVYIKDIVTGEFVKNKNFLKTKDGLEINKARILGTIVDKFVSSDENYALLILDDSTETIQARFFREEVSKIKYLKIGDIVDIIGFLKEYENEIYIHPIIVKKIDDPNWEILRKLELEGLPKITTKPLSEIVLQKVREMDSGDGVNINKLMEKLNKYENSKVLEVIRELMFKGDLFEPKKDFIKAIE